MIAIIAILAAILLPALSAARGRAEEAQCTSNMRQHYILASMFTNDMNDDLPSGYFQSRPDGRLDSDPTTPWGAEAAAAFQGYRNHFDMLIDYGYADLSEVARPVDSPGSGYSSWNQTDWDRLARHVPDNIRRCPTGCEPGDDDWYCGNVHNRSYEVSGENRRRSVMMVQFTSDEDGTLYGSLNGYAINMLAGGTARYIYGARSWNNYGFHKRGHWRSRDPSDIAYIFEDNGIHPGSNHFRDGMTITYYNYGGYYPMARHRRYTSSNMFFLDGHLGTLNDRYETAGDLFRNMRME